MDVEDISEDHFYNGAVAVLQARRGYRFSIDAPILADFLPYSGGETALEVGTGSGIISLLALSRGKFSAIYGVELQERPAQLALANAQKNSLTDRFRVIHGDFNELVTGSLLPLGLKHIFSNPPYMKTDIGRLSRNEEVRHAKFETRLKLKDLLGGAARLLAPGGSLYLVLPYDRFDELHESAREYGFFACRTRLVFSFKDGKATRFLIQLTNDEVSPGHMDPLVIFADKGKYTEEMEHIFAGR